VSTDDDEIANFAKDKGVKVIKRPVEISGGAASSESAIIHALNVIKASIDSEVTLTVFLQATSPLRVSGDIAEAILLFRDRKADSLFSSSVAADLTIWNNGPHGLESVNFNYKNRLTRQVAPIQYVENGSIYIFRPELLLETGNRLGGRIETYIMKPWQIHEIDVQEDAELVEYYMERYLIGK
jgi:N-acylneuraminate cytidylyltransferase